MANVTKKLSKKSSATGKSRSLVKFYVTSEEYDAIHLAAALHRISKAEYCRQLAVTAAKEQTKGINFPKLGPTGSTAK